VHLVDGHSKIQRRERDFDRLCTLLEFSIIIKMGKSAVDILRSNLNLRGNHVPTDPKWQQIFQTMEQKMLQQRQAATMMAQQIGQEQAMVTDPGQQGEGMAQGDPPQQGYQGLTVTSLGGDGMDEEVIGQN
jgi:hypothetical protein